MTGGEQFQGQHNRSFNPALSFIYALSHRFNDDNFPNILKLVDEFEGVGKKHNATAGQICLAWLLAQGEDIIPIPGTKKIKYLKENLDALKIQLDADELKQIRGYAERANKDIPGDRYPTASLSTVFADTPELCTMLSHDAPMEARSSFSMAPANSHITVHQFLRDHQKPLPWHDALKEGENAINSLSCNDTRWIGFRQRLNEATSQVRAHGPNAYIYNIQPPLISFGPVTALDLKEWGEPVSPDEEYSLSELQDFECGIGAGVQIPRGDSHSHDKTETTIIKRRKQESVGYDAKERQSGQTTVKRQRVLDEVSLSRLIPQVSIGISNYASSIPSEQYKKPHVHPSQFIPHPISVLAIKQYLKTPPTYIHPHDAERIESNPITSRFTWVIPVRGCPPWEGSTPASIIPDSEFTPSVDDHPKREIQWTHNSLLQFWEYLLNTRKNGSFGSLGVSFHFARKAPTTRGRKKLKEKLQKWPTPATVQTPRDSQSAVSLAAFDHIKVYHDAFVRLQLRTYLDNFYYKYIVDGHNNEAMVLGGVRLVLLDNRGQGVMLL
ncbi:hypothetical protein CVT24_003023 [Panaeolus cyanescens]|uniref:NADP-dependent oxidoreductase domain-containing protein n=1 Tax=Panaeolus cyanescens TaxID=181874 RepID=A0A409W8S9_9AGAR|nr:hypothetical protein CVT24_003023 [Panaeolus cyanescens]